MRSDVLPSRLVARSCLPPDREATGAAGQRANRAGRQYELGGPCSVQRESALDATPDFTQPKRGM